jgi:hypothetical protein
MNGWMGELVEVRPSSLHGLGVFATVDIPQGTVWWAADIADTIKISRDQFQALVTSAPAPMSDALIAGIQEYSIYVEALDQMILIPDNGRYVNHSDAPNSLAHTTATRLASVALRDIKAGEEIVEDYATYDWCPWPNVAPEFHDVHAQPAIAARS